MSVSNVKSFFAIFVVLLFCLAPQASNAFFGADYLLQLNGEKYFEEDYRHWWAQWQEPGMAVHESLDPYVDFLLLSGEAADMQLSDNPAYRKKLDVFLKVRTLMQLKSEEVDARKVIPSRDELWENYLTEYTPFLNLQMVAVAEDEQADKLKQLLADGVPFEQIVSTAGFDSVAEQMDATGLMRFTRIPEMLRPAVLSLEQGQSAGPVKYGHVWYFIHVLERKGGNEEDFESLKQNLIRDSLKQQEARLTGQMLERLKEEYQVNIDRELIDGITENGIAEEDADKVAMTIGELKIPVSFVNATIRKAQKLRGNVRKGAESFTDTRERIVNDILVQVLTERAAKERHYEEVPPLKHVFDFYRQYRLVKEFEATVVRPQVKVSDEDIAAYYRDNGEQFAETGLIEYAQVTTNEKKLAERILRELKQGADFFAVMQPISPAGVELKKEPLDHLQPVIKDAVSKLASGQTTTVTEGVNTHFIKVVRAVETKKMPLAQVREMIVKTLEKQKFIETRDKYLRLLRERSTIKVNKSKWETLRKQLLKENAS